MSGGEFAQPHSHHLQPLLKRISLVTTTTQVLRIPQDPTAEAYHPQCYNVGLLCRPGLWGLTALPSDRTLVLGETVIGTWRTDR